MPRVMHAAVVTIEPAAIVIAAAGAAAAGGGVLAQLAHTLAEAEQVAAPQLPAGVAADGHPRLRDATVFAVGPDMVGAKRAFVARHCQELKRIDASARAGDERGVGEGER